MSARPAPKHKIQQHVRERVARKLARAINDSARGNKSSVARACSLSQPYLYKILKSETSPTIDTLSRLADALGIDIRDLFEP